MYVVVFTGKSNPPAFFASKEAAQVYKSEHPNGKFAAVIKDSGTAFEGTEYVEH